MILIVGGTLRVVSGAQISANGVRGSSGGAGGTYIVNGGASGGGNVLVLCRTKGSGADEPIVGTNILATGGIRGDCSSYAGDKY